MKGHFQRKNHSCERCPKNRRQSGCGTAYEHHLSICPAQVGAAEFCPKPGAHSCPGVDTGAFEAYAASEADRGRRSQHLWPVRPQVHITMMLMVGADNLIG